MPFECFGVWTLAMTDENFGNHDFALQNPGSYDVSLPIHDGNEASATGVRCTGGDGSYGSPYTFEEGFDDPNASGGTEYIEIISTVDDSFWNSSFSGEHFTVYSSDWYNYATPNGIAVGYDCDLIIEARNDETIEKVELTITDYYWNANDTTASAGTVVVPNDVYDGDVITVNDVNASSVTVSNENSIVFNLVKIYYASALEPVQ